MDKVLTALDSLKVPRFFKATPWPQWNQPNYIEWERNIDPFSSYAAFNYRFKNDLAVMQDSDLIPAEAKTLIGCLLKIKGKVYLCYEFQEIMSMTKRSNA